VSGDFRNHSVGYFVEGLFKALNPNEFEIYAFQSQSNTDDLTERLKPCVKEWIPIHAMNDLAVATLIHQKGIQVLVDLSGHSALNRLPVFAYKPSPLQISWLGFPMTTGVPEMDYVLGDPWALPHAYEDHFVESIWRMPSTYVCMAMEQEDAEMVRELDHKKDFITFGSFNNLSKINNAVIAAWSQILKSVSGSKLYLKCKQLENSGIQSQILNRFASQGITEERLIFSGELRGRKSHLQEYLKVDVALDTFPFPGVTTSVEALWMGVPVLSVKGHHFLSSTASSIAINAGLGDWVATDSDDYVTKAVAFASDRTSLSGIRQELRKTIRQSALFDSRLFAQQFGEALQGMWRERLTAIGAVDQAHLVPPPL
jgi:predicted O-linked N-acetylglucosamine transferase (SPINDLY family)